MDNPFSIYIHIPFCQTRCTYCAFNTYAGLQHLIPAYLDALQQEIDVMSRSIAVSEACSLYLGGGTPSLLSPQQVARLIEATQRKLGLRPDSEITLEANPNTVSQQGLDEFRAAGVNRLSFGVQSSHDAELRTFGRSHTYYAAQQTYHAARAAGFDNISLDLIYGTPIQSLESWAATLETILTWEPEHISLYSLTLEPGTLLHQQVEQGSLPEPDSDITADMYELACSHLSHAGFEHYEISNWAQPGCESRHNQQYWLNRPYLGFGAGAHGSVNGIRYWNVSPVQTYIDRLSHPQPEILLSPAVEDYETIGRELEMSETVILGLRLLRQGVSRRDFYERFGQTLDEIYSPVVSELTQAGLLIDDGEHIRLAEQAYFVSNRIFMRFLRDS